MKVDRRHVALASAGALSLAIIGAAARAVADTADEADVKQAVEALRKAMLANDRAQLDALTAEQLSYGHSSGRVESKPVFIEGAMKGHWKFINVSDETTAVVSNNAISRFVFTGQSESDGKVNDVKIGILMVWLKQDGNWKLLARQAVKI
jgi:hypothetical protein